MAFKQKMSLFKNKELLFFLLCFFYQFALCLRDKQKGVNCSCCRNHNQFQSPVISSLHLYPYNAHHDCYEHWALWNSKCLFPIGGFNPYSWLVSIWQRCQSWCASLMRVISKLAHMISKLICVLYRQYKIQYEIIMKIDAYGLFCGFWIFHLRFLEFGHVDLSGRIHKSAIFAFEIQFTLWYNNCYETMEYLLWIYRI